MEQAFDFTYHWPNVTRRDVMQVKEPSDLTRLKVFNQIKPL